MSKCPALAKHHAQLALPDPASTMEKPDNEDAGKSLETLPKTGERYSYNQPGSSISEHSRAVLQMAGL